MLIVCHFSKVEWSVLTVTSMLDAPVHLAPSENGYVLVAIKKQGRKNHFDRTAPAKMLDPDQTPFWTSVVCRFF